MRKIINKISSIILLIVFLIQPVAQVLFNISAVNADYEKLYDDEGVYQYGRYVYGDNINYINWNYNADMENYELTDSEIVYYLEFNATIKTNYNKSYYNQKDKGTPFYATSDNRFENTGGESSSIVNMYIINIKDDSTRKNGIELTLRGRYYSKKYSAAEAQPTDVITLKVDDPSGVTYTQRVKADVTVSYQKYTWLVWPKGSKKPGTRKFESTSSSSSNTSTVTNTTSTVKYTEKTEEKEEKEPDIDIPYGSGMLFIRDLYKRALLREPSEDELKFWNRNYSIPKAAINIMLSPEADEKSNANYLTYEEFVKYCYRVILGKEAKTSELDNYKDKLKNGSITKEQVIKELIYSQEFLDLRNKKVKSIRFTDERLFDAVYNYLLKQDVQVVLIPPANSTITLYEDDVLAVKTLDISGKEIRTLSGLEKFENLTKLIAQNNNIATVDRITRLPLEYLNLNNNKLDENDCSYLKDTQTLEELYLDNNCIKEFYTELPNLKVLSLNNNQLKKLPNLKKLKNLKELYLDSNEITDVTDIEESSVTKFSIKNNTASLTWYDVNYSLPIIIKNAKKTTSKIYTSQDYECVNCTVKNDEIILDDGYNEGTVTVKGGNADGSTFTYKNLTKIIYFQDKVLADKLEQLLSKTDIGVYILSKEEKNGKYCIKLALDSIEQIVDLDLSTEPGEPQITNLSGLETFTGLESLDLSGNNISDFSPLNKLIWLETLKIRNCNLSNLNCLNNLRSDNVLQNLDASNNSITNISGVSNTPKLNKLLLSNNNIKDNLAPLKNLTKLKKLYVANNNITDISAVKDLKLSNLVCSSNSINNEDLSTFATEVTALNNVSTKTANNDGTIEIPKEVKDAIDSGNNNVEFVNCTLNNQKIALNEGEIKGKVIIKSGKFNGSIININAPIDNTPPVINISYRENTETNQIEAVITSNEELDDLPFFKRSEDKKTLVKSYGYNTSELLEVSDLAGNKTPAQINITQFDNNRIPGFTVRVNNTNFENNVTNENVIVTISADVPLHKPDYGDYWTISNDGKTLTRTFDTKTVLYQTIYSQADWELDRELRPRYLNGETELLEQLNAIESRKIDVRLEIPNIDKVAPECSVEYSTKEITTDWVRATIWGNEEIKLLNSKGFDVTKTTKLDDNGNTIYGLTLFFNKNGTETFVVKDLAYNTTAVEISVNNIDNKIDGLTSKQNNSIISNQNASVTIKANENIGLANQNSLQGKIKSEFAKSFKQVVKQAKINNKLYKIANSGNSDLGLVTRIADNNQSNLQQQIEYDLEDNDTDTLDIIDEAGNVDTVLYSVNTIDKTAPVAVREKDVFNTDGSKTITYWVNEKLANMDELNGWTYDEQTSTISKTFNTNTREFLNLKDFAGNESEEEVSVEGVNKVKYEVSFVYYEKSNKYLVKITADTKLKKVDGWDISEDEKTLSKYMNPDEEEILYIEDYEGNGSEVKINLSMAIEEETSESKTDTTVADKVIPQTGKYSLITGSIILILMAITFITLKNYLKNED